MTVAEFLTLAREVTRSVDSGAMDPQDEIHISLEVTTGGDESTYNNRVYGHEVIQANVVTNLGGYQYVHLQLIGVPNYK
jgi:hypothetical protein